MLLFQFAFNYYLNFFLKVLMTNKIFAILGPTASGKTGYSLQIAQIIQNLGRNPHILNCDSLQLMDGLPILTASPTPQERAICEHHLFSILHPNVMPTALMWYEKITQKLDDLLQDEKNIPIIVGGTGFYFDVLVNGLSNIPQIPGDVRRELVEKKSAIGMDDFYDFFANLDPKASQIINKNDSQRVLRACEVKLFTDKSIVDFWKEKAHKSKYDISTILVMPGKEGVYKNCRIRLESMVKCDVFGEISSFNQSYPNYHGKLREAIGYLEFSSFLSKKINFDTAIELAFLKTKHYAKRQFTWFQNKVEGAVVVSDDLQKKSVAKELFGVG